MTQYVHPEFGIFCPAPRLRRWLRVALACVALAAIGFAMMATGDRPDAESALAAATADESPAVESSPAASVTPRASVAGMSTFAGTQVGAEKTSCVGETWVYVDGKCAAAKPRKPRMVRVPVYRPAIASIPLGRNVAPIASVGESGAVAGTARNRQGDASKPAQVAPADSATAAAAEPAERPVAAPKRKTARNQNRRREQYGYGGWREVRVDDWWARGGYGSRERYYSRGGYGQGSFRSFW
jgi:hypothetical protein